MKSNVYPGLHTGLAKHHPLTIAMHWGTVLCIVIAVVAVLLREYIGDKYWRNILLETHRQLGLVILIGVVVRLYVRQRHGLSDHTRHLPKIMRMAAFSVQLALYGLLVVLPLLGWASMNAHNRAVDFLGLLPLPSLSPEDSEWADQLSDYHVLGAWLLLGMVMLHAGAALFHHFIRGDTVLWAMLPRKSERFPELSSSPVRRRRAGLHD